MKTIALLVVLALTGCANMSGLNADTAAVLAQSKPISMCTLKGEGYMVMSGLPLPLGTRMPDLDALCAARKVTP